MKTIKESMSPVISLVALIILLAFLLLMSYNSSSQDQSVNGYASADTEIVSLKNPPETMQDEVEDPSTFYRKGMTFLEANSPNKAQLYFEYAILKDPNFFDPYLKLSYIKTMQWNYDLAEFYARKAIELKPENSMAHLELSKALIGQRKLNEAEREIAAAAVIDP